MERKLTRSRKPAPTPLGKIPGRKKNGNNSPHCDALIKANKKLDDFEKAKDAFYELIYRDVGDNRELFLAAVRNAQIALRNGLLPLARVNDSQEKAGEWFDKYHRSACR